MQLGLDGLGDLGVDVGELTKRYEAGKRRRNALEESWGEALEALERADAETEGV